MNLNFRIDGEKISLRQTPSQITYMCVAQPDGTTPYELKGKKAVHALRIYMQWVKYSINGVWESSEDLQNAEERVKEELEYLESVLMNHKKIVAYVM